MTRDRLVYHIEFNISLSGCALKRVLLSLFDPRDLSSMFIDENQIVMKKKSGDATSSHIVLLSSYTSS